MSSFRVNDFFGQQFAKNRKENDIFINSSAMPLKTRKESYYRDFIMQVRMLRFYFWMNGLLIQCILRSFLKNRDKLNNIAVDFGHKMLRSKCII